ncbi:MFS transporter [Clostridium carboxidivorans P7]|uniref:Major facilitator superfamily MFS_1 n=1 Tax=Clostridium carboxidivorans P7 TaxID=536227 RepID=C6PZL2_9CLOT|nr:MFS transporter [Clostridium carboxidivorans]AKN31879.1 MFS transporter [Clostridium carboxidivorans P7]EET85324.1 major facilitator superfamily MFS_1 [Clostridium carboxidivorans P7]
MNRENLKTRDEQIKKVESYRWVVWTILAAVYIFVTFHRMSAGVVKNDLQQAFSIGAAQFANIGSMYFYAYFIMQIPSGILADKLGPKRTVSMFSILAAIGSVVFGLAPNIGVAYVGRFLVGIGVSVVFICLIKIQSRWFYSRNFALMIGFAGLAANLGAILAQTPLVIAAQKFGWRNTFVFMGLAMVVFAALTMIFVKDDPKDMGLPGMDELENRPAVSANIKVMPALKSIITNKRTWVISLAYIGLYTGYVVFLGTFGVSFLMQAYSLTKVKAANYVISAVIGSSVSGLIIGYLSDRFKNRKIPLVLSTTLTLIGWIILIYTRMPLSLLTPFLFVFGFVMTGFTMCWTVGNEVNDRRLSGMATGVVNCVGFLGAAVIPVVMGNILDKYKNVPAVGYEKAYFVLIILMAVSTAASFFSAETRGKNIYQEK